MTYEELDKLASLLNEYVATLSNEYPDEWYCTAQEMGEEFVADFLAWAGTKIGESI